jgi:hypothetical protein
MRVVGGSAHGSRMEDVFEFRKDDYRIQPVRQGAERSKLVSVTQRSMKDVTTDKPFGL